MAYHKIDDKIWDDEKFRQLSLAGKAVFLHLITNTLTNFIGFYTIKPASAAEDIGIKLTDLNAALEEILKLEMAIYDKENRVILLRNFLQYNPIGGEKQMKGVENALKKLPRTKLIYNFREILEEPKIREEGRNEDILEVVDRFLGTMNLEGIDPTTFKPEEVEGKDLPAKLNLHGLVDTWNEICGPILAQVKSLPPRRETAIKSRMRERPDLEEWKGIFQRIASSAFLRGENKDGWKAHFDWVLNPNNLAKILEGNYDDRKNSAGPKRGMDAIRAMAEETLPRNQMSGGDDDEGSIPEGDSPTDQMF